MTITPSNDCQQITIGITDFNVNNQSVKLKVTIGCADTGTVITVPVSSTTTVVTPSTLSLTTLADQVYTFELTTVQQDGTIIYETRCYFLNCNTGCALKESILTALEDPEDTKVFNKATAYIALKTSNECSGCKCTDLCDLYNFITDTTDDTYCPGCTQH